MWPFNLSVRLPIVGLVGSYPANYLIGRKLISGQQAFDMEAMQFPYVMRY